MNNKQSRTRRKAFTLIELLVVVLILGILTAVALPSYISSVNAGRQGAANANSRALATAVQTKALQTGTYDSTLANYATDMGGALPTNPCTGTTTGYVITPGTSNCTVAASAGTACGTWTPATFTVGFKGG